MKYAWFAPLERDVSRLVLGTAGYLRAPLDVSLELLDAWLELGGNAIDTARRYGNSEAIVGRWLHERGCRDEVVLATKGAHYDVETGRSRVNPEEIDADLAESIAQLGVDTIDVYWLHRDDPAQPVGPIIETLNRHRLEGRIRVFGASNWSHERLEEANAYAEANGLESFACSSPQLSLAVPREEPWPGCVSIHKREALEWYARTQLPVFAWSAQAAGFFAGVRDEDVTRVYGGGENAERLRRAQQLAARKGCTVTQVALAWVVHQRFPAYAIIGPRSIAELRESVGALALELTADEARWLDLAE
jgi:aryl-alcohol dehydrogenase-like predicted oxidoreductase